MHSQGQSLSLSDSQGQKDGVDSEVVAGAQKRNSLIVAGDTKKGRFVHSLLFPILGPDTGTGRRSGVLVSLSWSGVRDPLLTSETFALCLPWPDKRKKKEREPEGRALL